VSGTIDELITPFQQESRPFVSNDAAQKGLAQMGRIDASIFVIGSDVDMHEQPTQPANKPITKYRLRKYGSLFHLAHRGKIQHEPMPIIL
jgi:hypothetical protein